jgi:hypothetical protein
MPPDRPAVLLRKAKQDELALEKLLDDRDIEDDLLGFHAHTAHGSITFEPTAGTRGPIAGGEIVGGRYDIPTAIGPAIGTTLVRVSVMGRTGRTVLGSGGQLGDEIAETLPAHCNTASTLQVEIKKGRNELNLDLRSKPE